MSRPKVYVTTNEIPESAVDILRTVASTRINEEDGPPPRQRLLDEARDAEGIFCLLTEKVDKKLLSAARRLKVVANMAVGYDNVDLTEATTRRVMITNTPGVLTETVADLTMGLIMAVARRIVEANRYVRGGKWTIPWSPMMMVGSDVHGKTLGILGLGRIGAAVARRAKGFDMKVIYSSRSNNRAVAKTLGAERVPLDRLLRDSDFLSIHTPLTPETRHMIGAREIAKMKASAFIINTARGAIVDEVALVGALSKKQIAGAALDVFEREPISKDNPLLKFENVIMLPHIGSGSLETRTAMATMAARNIVAALKGEVPPNLVNKELH